MKRLFPRLLLGATVCYWLTIFVATHIPSPDLPAVEVNDKTVHFVAYALLATLVFATLRTTFPRVRRAEALTIVLCLVYGAFDESTQPLFNRYADINDWLANAAGVASAVGVMGLVWTPRRK